MRELWEETGLRPVDALARFAVQEVSEAGRVKHYFCGPTRARQEDVVLGEGAAMVFLSPAEVLDGRPYTPGTAEVLASFLASPCPPNWPPAPRATGSRAPTVSSQLPAITAGSSPRTALSGAQSADQSEGRRSRSDPVAGHHGGRAALAISHRWVAVVRGRVTAAKGFAKPVTGGEWSPCTCTPSSRSRRSPREPWHRCATTASRPQR